MSDFSNDIKKFAEKSKANLDEVVRAFSLGLLRGVVLKSPVGNPDLWKSNQLAAAYNLQVVSHNDALRSDPMNLNKRGYLKRGKKLHDGMDIKAPPGYVGGAFRRNWQVTVGAPATGTVGGVDPGGQQSIADAQAVLATVKAGQTIYITNNLSYGPRLEYEGWSKQAPAGMVRVTIAEAEIILRQAVESLTNN